MENLNHKVLGIMGIFKIPYKISPADRYTVYLAIQSLIRVLPGFFRCLEVGQESDVIIIPLSVKGNPKYSQRYLVVIQRISEVIGTNLYCKKILEDNNIKPIEQIYIVGQKAEVVLVNLICNYLYFMVEGITRTSRFATLGSLNGKAHKKKVEVDIFIEVYNKLESALGFRNSTSPEEGLKIREKKRLQFIIKNLKLDYNKKNDPNNPNIDNAKSLPGLFKNNKLL